MQLFFLLLFCLRKNGCEPPFMIDVGFCLYEHWFLLNIAKEETLGLQAGRGANYMVSSSLRSNDVRELIGVVGRVKYEDERLSITAPSTITITADAINLSIG